MKTQQTNKTTSQTNDYLNLFCDENDRCGKKIDCRKKETPDMRSDRHDVYRMVPVQCAAHKSTI